MKFLVEPQATREGIICVCYGTNCPTNCTTNCTALCTSQCVGYCKNVTISPWSV